VNLPNNMGLRYALAVLRYTRSPAFPGSEWTTDIAAFHSVSAYVACASLFARNQRTNHFHPFVFLTRRQLGAFGLAQHLLETLLE
jgi:hypothetical protein